uniref:Cytochrome c domain-containing protein n=1 Tax=uncultured bacterium BAC10-10 TaxID=333372 RepID=Q4JIQ4_9BACT|nr:hypothetical protein [uncultured bacterium BAC10-10]
MTRTLIAAALAWIVLVPASLGARQVPPGSPPSLINNPVPLTAKSIDTGRQRYQKYCRPCHGEDAHGDGPLAPKDVHPPDLTDASWTHGSSDGDIFTTIREGIGPKFTMRSWKSQMTDAEIWNIVNYLRSLAQKAGAP